MLGSGVKMKNILWHGQTESPPRKVTTKLVSLRDKLEILKTSIEETQKYELLTTNQYLKHIEVVVSILESLSEFTNQKQELNGR